MLLKPSGELSGDAQAATDLARNPAVISALQRPSNLTDLFGQLAHVKEKAEVGVEVYDDLGDLIAWDGISGPAHRERSTQGLGPDDIVYHDVALHTQLFIVTPVRSDSIVVGVVLFAARSMLTTR
jgi:hypothetical protein